MSGDETTARRSSSHARHRGGVSRALRRPRRHRRRRRRPDHEAQRGRQRRDHFEGLEERQGRQGQGPHAGGAADPARRHRPRGPGGTVHRPGGRRAHRLLPNPLLAAGAVGTAAFAASATAPNAAKLDGKDSSDFVAAPEDGWHIVGAAGEPQFLAANAAPNLDGACAGGSSSWANYEDGYARAAYFRDSFGIVHLKGLVTGGAFRCAIFQLPPGFRPGERPSSRCSSISRGPWPARCRAVGRRRRLRRRPRAVGATPTSPSRGSRSRAGRPERRAVPEDIGAAGAVTARRRYDGGAPISAGANDCVRTTGSPAASEASRSTVATIAQSWWPSGSSRSGAPARSGPRRRAARGR